jgi:hypothetical protein
MVLVHLLRTVSDHFCGSGQNFSKILIGFEKNKNRSRSVLKNFKPDLFAIENIFEPTLHADRNRFTSAGARFSLPDFFNFKSDRDRKNYFSKPVSIGLKKFQNRSQPDL